MFPQHAGIARAFADGQLLVVVGSIVREAAGLLGSRELVEAGLASVDGDEVTREAIRGKLAAGQVAAAFEAIKDRLGPNFVRIYEPLLSGPKVMPPASLRALAALAGQLRLVLTTNLDHLVENTLSGPWVGLDEVTADLATRKHTVVKLLGTAHNLSSWRFTADGLQIATYRRRHVKNALSALLGSHQLLLIGYRGDDELVHELVRLREHAPDDRNAPQWVALVPPGTSGVDRAAHGKRGLHLIEVGGRDAISYDTAVATYIRQLARDVPTAGLAEAAIEPQIAGNPYPGLAPFDATQAAQFFGRVEACAAALGKLGTNGGVHVHWLALTGASGVGKSSLLAAGVVPALRAATPPVRDAPMRWVIAQMRPGREVLRNLAAAIREAIGRDLGIEVGPASLTRTDLIAQDRTLVEFLAARLGGRGMLLVIDQCEEAFTVGREEDRPHFDALLVRSLQDVEVPFYLLTAMRSDCAGQLGRHFPGLAELQNAGTLCARHDLQPLRAHELRDAIQRPAELGGRVCEPGLVERILHDAGALQGPQADDTDGRGTPDATLPLVAHVLHALYAHAAGPLLSLRAYEDLGGVAESLTRDADRLLGSLAGEYPLALVRGLLVELVELHPHGRDTRRVVPWSTAVAAACDGEGSAARTRAETLLRRLSGGTSGRPGDPPSVRLIATRGEGEHVVVDLVHDALLRDWTTLRGWLQEDREIGLLRQELTRAAEGWVKRGRPDDELWRGGRLAHASEALRTRRLPEDAQVFLAASSARVEAEFAARAAEQADKLHVARRNNRRLLGLGGLLLVVAIVAWVQYWSANRAAALAEKRLDAGNQLVHRLMFEAFPELRRVPGTVSVQRTLHELLEELQATLSDGSLEGAPNTTTLSNRAVQHFDRGGLAHSYDNLDVALPQFKDGVKLMEVLVELDPENSTFRHNLAVMLSILGVLEGRAGNDAADRAHTERAVALGEGLVATNPQNAEIRRHLAVYIDNLGGLDEKSGDPVAARRRYERILSIMEELVRDFPDAIRHRIDLCTALKTMGSLEESRGDLVAARSHYQRALRLAEGLMDSAPDDESSRRSLAGALSGLGRVERSVGNFVEAREYFQRALALSTPLYEADPEDSLLRSSHSTLLESAGVLEMDVGAFAAGRSYFEQSRAIVEELVAKDPRDHGFRIRLSHVLNSLGVVAQLEGDLGAARTHFEQALAIREEMLKDSPENINRRREVSHSLTQLGKIEGNSGDLELARLHLSEALLLDEALVAEDPEHAALLGDLSAALDGLGMVEQSAGDYPAAYDLFLRALQIDEHIAAGDPVNMFHRGSIVKALQNLADVESHLGDIVGARGHLEQALAILESSSTAVGPARRSLGDRIKSLRALGNIEKSAGRREKARTYFERALAITEDALATTPKDARVLHDRSNLFTDLGSLARAVGDLAEAAMRYEQSLHIISELANADPLDAEIRFALVLSHLNLVILAGEQDEQDEKYDHLLAADAALSAMETSGQSTGFAQREDVRGDINQFLNTLSNSLKGAANTELHAGNVAAGRRLLAQAYTIDKRLGVYLSKVPAFQDSYASLLKSLARAELDSGAVAMARSYLTEALSIREVMVAAEPDNVEYRRDLALLLQYFGETEIETREAEAARDYFERSLVIREELVAQNPFDRETRIELSVSLERLGHVAESLKNLSAARDYAERALALREELGDQYPHDATVRYNLCASLQHVGWLDRRAGDPAKARAQFERALAILARIRDEEDCDARCMSGIAAIHMNLHFVTQAVGSADEARTHLHAAGQIMNEMGRNGQISGFTERERMRSAIGEALRDAEKN